MTTTSAQEDQTPRAIAGASGLFGMVGGGGIATSAGSRIGVVLVNSTSAPLELPAMKLALRVYRKGGLVPCEGEPAA